MMVWSSFLYGRFSSSPSTALFAVLIVVVVASFIWNDCLVQSRNEEQGKAWTDDDKINNSHATFAEENL
jgi:hypothetical protein